MKRIGSKRGQQIMGMPFSMMFAIFLIIIFIVVAFMGIRFFLSFGRTADVGLFYEELQGAVDDAWSGQSGSFSFEINLPDKIQKICFANLSAPITGNREEYNQIELYEFKSVNLFLIPPGDAEGMHYKQIEHLDLARIIETQNPYCVDVKDGLTIQKDFYDKLVWIE
ncbi:MAG: hypothetical protein KKF50_03645 [Nanoarchaeota archaeon]|nr:hypothetical protein [Nanoarchaeota archaeon]